MTRGMTTDTRAPRTVAGRDLLRRCQSGWKTSLDEPIRVNGMRRMILAIEAEAHDQALGALLLTAGPGPGGVPLSVMSKENIDRALASVEARWQAEATADPVAAGAEIVSLLLERYGWEVSDGYEWNHAHCDEDSGGNHRLDGEWLDEDIKAWLRERLPTPAPEKGEGE